jgi:hypothetical protein
MSELLGFVPILASATLGLIYLWMGEGNTLRNGAGIAIFLLAAYLQFFSPYLVAGLLIQVLLALTLEFWRRMQG